MRFAGLLLTACRLLEALVLTTELDAVLVPGVGIAFVRGYLTTRHAGLLISGGF